MNPPPLSSETKPAKKKFGCLKVLGILFLLFIALCIFAAPDAAALKEANEARIKAEAEARLIDEKQAEEAKARFAENKARVLEDLSHAAEVGDGKAVTLIAREYRTVTDEEFRSALASAESQLAKIREEKRAAEAKSTKETGALEEGSSVPKTVEKIGRDVLGDKYQKSSALPNESGWIVIIEAKTEIDGSAETEALLIKEKVMKLAEFCHPKGMNVLSFTVIYRTTFNDGLGNESEGKLLHLEVPAELAGKINWQNPDAIKFERAFRTVSCHPGFRAAWHSIVPPPPQKYRTGISYRQVMEENDLESLVKMESVGADDGTPRWQGRSSNQLVLLEIIGDPQNIESATLLCAAIKDDNDANQANAVVAATLLRNCDPSWKGSTDWLGASVKKLADKKAKTVSVVRGGNRISVRLASGFGYLIKVESQEAPDSEDGESSK